MVSHVHFVGIGGAGLSAIAAVLLEQGFTISGSDMQASEATERLQSLGATVFVGHAASNLDASNLDVANLDVANLDVANLAQPDVVVVSSAIPADNPEVIEAQRRHIPVQKRPAWLGQMMANRRGIAIAGTHGKTTTTAMVSFILSRAGLSPTFIIGGVLPQLDRNAAAGQSDLFVLEADEYDRTFLSLRPEIAVITNLEWDHIDTYPTETAYRQAFLDFTALVPAHGHLIVCGDDPGIQKIQAQLSRPITYGLGSKNIWQAVNPDRTEAGNFEFAVYRRGQAMTEKPISLNVPGLHNVQNGLAALIVAHQIGLPVAQAGQFLAEFSGTGRRLEIKGEVNGITVVDDYAHHPTEVNVTLAAAKTRFDQRPIWAAFQPHSFSRTKLYLEQFAAAFDQADHVILLDIYPAREQDDGTISSAHILARMQHNDAQHIGSIPAVVDYLEKNLSAGDVLLTLSAGDGNQVGEEILQRLQGNRMRP